MTTVCSGDSLPSGYVDNENDCDDTNPDMFIGNPEVCDGFDNDCDGDTDEGVTTTYYLDGDSDGFGLSAFTVEACSVPVGYADGYKHQLSNKGQVLIRGTRCRVLGAVSMDQIVVDVTALPDVESGDMAILIGTDGSDSITVEELAHLAGTIPYDILTGIGPRVRREYMGG